MIQPSPLQTNPQATLLSTLKKLAYAPSLVVYCNYVLKRVLLARSLAASG